jgi:hypothetical protein
VVPEAGCVEIAVSDLISSAYVQGLDIIDDLEDRETSSNQIGVRILGACVLQVGLKLRGNCLAQLFPACVIAGVFEEG